MLILRETEAVFHVTSKFTQDALRIITLIMLPHYARDGIMQSWWKAGRDV